MTQLAFDLAAAIFATLAIVDIWFNGSIFAEARQAVQQWPALPTPSRVRSLTAELLGCPLCLNTQVASWVTIWLTAAHFAPPALATLLRMPIYAFAAAGAAWALNERRPGGGYGRGSHKQN